MGNATALKKTIAQVKYTIGGIKNAFASAFSGIGSIISKIVGPLGLAFGGGGLIATMTYAVKKFAEAEMITRKLERVLKSTGYAAGFSARQMENMASKFSKSSTFSGADIKSAQTVLATFRNIQGDMFTETTQAALDLSAVMGQDLQSSVVQLGKAMNDPVRGITALRRVGVSFSDEQQKQIKNLVKQNELVAAQRMILDEMKTEFGGAAAAEAESLGGKIRSLQKDIGAFTKDLGASIAGAFDMTGTLTDIRSVMAELRQWAQFGLPEWINTVRFLWLEFKFGALKAWEVLKAAGAWLGVAYATWWDSLKKIFEWIPTASVSIVKVVATAWIDGFKSVFNFISSGFKGLWEAVKTGSMKGFTDAMELAMLDAQGKIMRAGLGLMTSLPELNDPTADLEAIYMNLNEALAGLDLEREKQTADTFAKQMENINKMKGTSIEKKPFIPAVATAATKQAIEIVAAKFSGAAERGSLEAYKIEIGNQLNVQKKIESNTADAAENSNKIVDLLEDINDNLEGGEVFAF